MSHREGKRALVTGARGFIGRHCLAELAARGFEVFALTTATEAAPVPDSLSVHWRPCDLLRESDFDRLLREIRPSHLLHLAWVTTPGAYPQAAENLAWVAASLRLSLAFALAGGRRMVTAGTCLEYAVSDEPCVEDRTPLAPRSLYAVCKLRLAEILTAFAEQHSVSAAWARLFFLYGPHEPAARLFPAVIRPLLRGEAVRFTQGMQVRDYLHAADAGAALAALLDSQLTGPVNIGSGEAIRLRDLVLSIAAPLKGTVKIEWGALPERPQEPPTIVADVTRLNSVYPVRRFRPLAVGVPEAIAYWRDQERSAPIASTR